MSKYGEPLSNFAFNFNLRRYKEEDDVEDCLSLPAFAEAEQCVLDLAPRPAAAQVDPVARKRARTALATALNKIRRLEASAQAGGLPLVLSSAQPEPYLSPTCTEITQRVPSKCAHVKPTSGRVCVSPCEQAATARAATAKGALGVLQGTRAVGRCRLTPC